LHCHELKDKALTLLFKSPAPTAQKTLFIVVIRTNQFMLQGAKVAICFEINTKHVHTSTSEGTIFGRFREIATGDY